MVDIIKGICVDLESSIYCLIYFQIHLHWKRPPYPQELYNTPTNTHIYI